MFFKSNSNCVRGEMEDWRREEAERPRNQLQCYCIDEVTRDYNLNAVAKEMPYRAENRLRNI